MKRIISLTLLIVMLLNASAIAEDFTLHNGTKFGMTKEEVTKLEQENFFDLEQDEVSNEDLLYAHGRIAGIDDASVHYYFSNDSLYRMAYRFSPSTLDMVKDNEFSRSKEYFTIVENGLKAKYGDTKYNSSTLLSVPSFAENIPFDSHKSGKTDYIRHKYSHRLIELEMNEYVFIEHYIQELSYDLGNGPTSIFYDQVDYHYLDASSAENLFDKLDQQQDDL